MSTEQFYDELAWYYDLVFPDWDASMQRQGDALIRLIRESVSPRARESPRVLDVAAGIGTQSLPLAAHGCRITARDLSPEAIVRLGREAAARGLSVEAGVADMRAVAASVSSRFDAVICCDNSLPHLLTDRDIAIALSQFRKVLVEGGVCICSVRDYDRVDRAMTSHHDYGERRRGDRVFRLWQDWRWCDVHRYEVTFVVEERLSADWGERLRTKSEYYAIGTTRLLELMVEAGFSSCRRLDDVIYQPVLIGWAT